MTTTTQATRKTLAELNHGFARDGETPDFFVRTEYRVGKWGTRYSRGGTHYSHGSGGDKLHLVQATFITGIKPDYDWASYCRQSVHVSPYQTPEQQKGVREKHVRDHGQPWHHCRQPRVGDVLAVNAFCRHDNVRGTGAWTPEELETSAIDCINCRARFFGEAVDGVEERRVVRAGIEARKAARPQPARCFWCGDIRPKTKATLAGEVLPCGYCKEQFETIYWVETTGYSNSYFAEMAEGDTPEHNARMLALGLEDETKACEVLERREGKYVR